MSIFYEDEIKLSKLEAARQDGQDSNVQTKKRSFSLSVELQGQPWLLIGPLSLVSASVIHSIHCASPLESPGGKYSQCPQSTGVVIFVM